MIVKLIQSKTAKQTIFLFLAQILGLVIGFIANMLLAKEMGAVKFGIYSLSLAVISFLSIFYEFGYFASSSRLLAQVKKESEERKLIAASFVIALIIALLFAATIFVISLAVDYVFREKIGYILRMTAVVSWSFIIPFYMELILKGNNHIELLSLFQIVWKILFIIALFFLLKTDLLVPLNVLYALSISCIVSFVFVIFKLKISFNDLKTYMKKIHQENKRYGIHIYFGRVIDVSTYQLDRLMIGYFANSKEVGFYSLANSMANPINTFSTSLSSSKFKSFANHHPIPKNVLIINFAWIILAIMGANLLGYLIINYYLGSEYKDVSVLLIFMTVAVGFQALYQPYNAWLSSNGYGREMKSLNFQMAFASVFLNFVFIPLWGAFGAAIASILVMAFAFLYYLRLYHNKLRYE